MNKTEYLQKFADKLSLTVAECEVEFNTLLTDEKTIHADIGEVQQEQRALQRLAL